MNSYLQKYHLQKVQPVKNRNKTIQNDFYKMKQKVQKSTVVKIPLKPRPQAPRSFAHYDDRRISQKSPIKSHKTEQLIRINDNHSQEDKQKKQDKASIEQKQSHRSHRSLNFKSGKDNSAGVKIFTTIQDFFAKIMKSNDGCSCGDPCSYSVLFFQWAQVPYQIVKDHYFKVLNRWEESVKEPQEASPSSQREIRDDKNLLSKSEEAKKIELKKNFIQIKKDIDRTQGQSTTFQNNVFKQRQIKILMCYATEDLKVGYIQGMNMILSGLLYHIKDQIRTYAVFRKLIFSMRSIYLNNFSECYQHIRKIKQYLKSHVNDLYQCLQELMVDLNIVCLPWILSLLTCIVPLEFLHLIYEGLISEKWNFFYKMSLSIMIYHKERMMSLEDSGEILLLFSPTNKNRQDYDWQDIIMFSKSLIL